MCSNHKRMYDSPTVAVVEVKSSGVICASGGSGTENYNPVLEQSW